MSDHDLLDDPLGLNIDLSTVDTSRPVIKTGAYLFTLKELARVEKKDDPTKHNLKAVYSLAQEAPSGREGDDAIISPGFQVQKFFPLQQSDNANAPDFRVDIVKHYCALLGVDHLDAAARPKVHPAFADLLGREITLTIKCKPDENGQLQNEVAGFRPPVAA